MLYYFNCFNSICFIVLYMSTSLTLFTKLYRIDKKLLHNLNSPTYFCPGTLYIVKTIFMTNCLLLFCLFVFFCFLFFFVFCVLVIYCLEQILFIRKMQVLVNLFYCHVFLETQIRLQ